MSKIAVLVPCYNESVTISSVVSDFKNALPEATIYVYDNNSTDGTYDIAKQAGAIVKREPRQGKGNVVRSMFRDIQADCYLLVDGDDTYPAASAAKMCNLVLSEGADMVVGDRLSTTYFIENKRRFHSFGNVLVRKLVNSIFKGDIRDIMSGYRAFSPLFAKTYPVLSKGFEIETDMTIFALDKNMHILTIPVDYQDRPAGSVSKLNTFRDGARVLRTIARLFKNYRPMLFFGLSGLVLFSVGLVFFVSVLIEYIQTDLVLRFPTLFLSLFLIMCAVQSFTCGLILDSIAENNRRLYELEFNRIKNKD